MMTAGDAGALCTPILRAEAVAAAARTRTRLVTRVFRWIGPLVSRLLPAVPYQMYLSRITLDMTLNDMIRNSESMAKKREERNRK